MTCRSFIWLLLTLIVFGFLLYKPANSACFCNHGYGLDEIEYHLLSANIALHNSFPVYGFLSDKTSYCLCEENQSLATYYTILSDAGPVLFSGRPPIYPLVLGGAYKLMGFTPQTQYQLHFAAIWLTALLLGIALLCTRGTILAVIISITYLWVTIPIAHINNAEPFTRLPYFAAILILIWAEYSKNNPLFFTAGIAMSLALITKGTLLIFTVLILLFMLFKALRYKNYTILKHIVLYCCGLALVIVPWSTFINYHLSQSKQERQNWVQKMNKAIPDISVAGFEDLLDKNSGWYKKETIYYGIKIHQTRYVADSAFIIITNQLNRNIILSDHNEFCADGDYHPEFEAISTSFHNRYSKTDEWVWKSIARFYANNPVFAMKILYTKICALSRTSTNLYFLSIVLITLALCFRHHIISALTAKLITVAYVVIYISALLYGLLYLVVWIPIICLLISLGIIALFYAEKGLLSIFTLLALSFTLLALMIYGDPRFIDALDAVWVLAATLSLTYIFNINLKQRRRLLQSS